MKKPKAAMATASLSSDSPSARIDSRLGAPTSRKMPITAAGSVVDTTAPSSRQTTRSMPVARCTTPPHDGDAHQHGDDRQQQHGEDLVEQAAHVDGQAGGEQQRRQEQRQEDVGADLELVEADEGVAQRAELDSLEIDPRAEEAQAHAGDRQQHGVRQAQALGQRHQQADHRQHHRDREQGVDGIGHLTNLPRLFVDPCRPRRPLAL